MAKPPSAARSDAARRNGALSHGPVTPEGKEASSRNAVRHGLCATDTRPEPEEQALFEALHAALVAQHGPADEAQEHWVRQMALVMLRERRLNVIEDRVTAALLDAPEKGPPPGLPSLPTILRYRARLERDWRHASGQLAAARTRHKQQARPVPARPQALSGLAAAFAHDPRAMQAAMPASGDEAAHPLADGTNEPGQHVRGALNRAQRRRLEACQRHDKAA
ncbi:hypothetical protein SH611_08250 [Geminicoccaceae bacterium 1502E]|nr:hypothetical protein [Geminicoccaceae bacterium 1502E]